MFSCLGRCRGIEFSLTTAQPSQYSVSSNDCESATDTASLRLQASAISQAAALVLADARPELSSVREILLRLQAFRSEVVFFFKFISLKLVGWGNLSQYFLRFDML